MTKTKNSILIPYTTESLNEETYFDERDHILHAVYCEKDNLHLFIKTTKLFGDTVAEPMLCPFCGEGVYRGEGLSHYVTTHELPEVIGCLQLNENKTLELVLQKSSSEVEKDGIKAILDRQNFSSIAKKIKSYQNRKLFQRSLKKFQISEILSTSQSLASFSKKLSVKKPIKQKCKPKPTLQGENINRATKKPQWTSEHGLELIKERWILSQKHTQKSLKDSEREEMKKRWFQMRNLLKGRTTLKKYSKPSRKKETLKFLTFNILNLHHEADPFQEIKKAR